MRFFAVLLALTALVGGCGNSTAGTSDTGSLGIILDTPEDPEKGVFSRALRHPSLGNLRNDLSSEGPYTVFVPTNAAFEAYFAEQGITKEIFLESDEAAEVVRAHIVSGDFPYTGLSQGATLTNLNGDPLTTALRSNVFYVNDAEVAGPIDDRPFIPGTEEVKNGSLYFVYAVITP